MMQTAAAATLALVTTFAVALSVAAPARKPAPGCDDLVWSAQVLAANPDIRESCQGVYVRNETFYAKVSIQLTKVRGDRLSFRPQLRNGTLGKLRSIRVDSRWRATIDGKKYRAGELQPGQVLSVYVPEDRFALAVHDGEFNGNEALIDIETPRD